jgi:hypothetical protein
MTKRFYHEYLKKEVCCCTLISTVNLCRSGAPMTRRFHREYLKREACLSFALRVPVR